MTSVRSAALIWMTILLTLVGLVGAGAAYTVDLRESNILLDGQLRQIALNAAPVTNAEFVPPQRGSEDLQTEREDRVIVQIWDAQGRQIYTNSSRLNIPRIARAGFGTVTAAGVRWRGFTVTTGGRTVQASQRASVRLELARTAALEAAVPILVTIPLGWLVVGWGLQRVLGRLGIVAASVAARGAEIKAPIPVDAIPEEVLPLVEAMNLLIGRLQTSIEQQKRFLSDAAHELRTPLTALRLQIDNLMPCRDATAIDLALPDLSRGADRASALIDQLLRLTHYDAVVDQSAQTPIELMPLVLACIADHLQIAESKEVDLGVTASDTAWLRGTERDLKVLFDNLVQNAVRYTPAGGVVDIAVRTRDGMVEVEVSDTGVGIREDVLPRVFDRFFRAAPTHIEGTGLGLSICAVIAARHGLSITLRNRTEGQGLVATVKGAAEPTMPRQIASQPAATKWVSA